MTRNMEQQLVLLRLIVSKMEIKSETEEMDEGEFNPTAVAADNAENSSSDEK